MAVEAGRTGILVATHPLVIIGQLRRIIMFVTIDTTEGRKITRCSMTINALIPFSFVFSTVNREILLVVVKTGRLPGVF